jgi:hypothetical protein
LTSEVLTVVEVVDVGVLGRSTCVLVDWYLPTGLCGVPTHNTNIGILHSTVFDLRQLRNCHYNKNNRNHHVNKTAAAVLKP